MPIRDVVEINEELCDGCRDCVPSCAEGAIQIIDGKAKLVGDVYCDGLGACLGICPTGAITVIKREAESFDEGAVAEHLASLGDQHAPPAETPLPMVSAQTPAPSCPGSRTIAWDEPTAATETSPEAVRSGLRQWPIQLHLLPPTAPFLEDADLLVAADCAAYSMGGFHRRFLDGRALAIACPKLDSHQEIYVEKLAAMIDHARLRQMTVMVMEVPCCNGLVGLVQEARARAGREIPATALVVGVRGDVLATRPL
jgi:NAD-dependent dihydropyrimidine dehydrogenase PreA subunit